MDISPTFVTVYLVIGILVGLQSIFLGLHFKAKNPQDVRARRRIPRGCLWVITEVVILILFRSEMLGKWTAFGSSGILLIIIEYALVAAEKLRARNA
jgi:hypothetical protein